MAYNYRKPVINDAERKKAFHLHCRRQLERLAEELGLDDDDYDIRSVLGGPAVSGEIILHADQLYVMAQQLPGGGREGLMFRACKSRKDYIGGQNHFLELMWLDSPKTLAEHIKRILPNCTQKARRRTHERRSDDRELHSAEED
ncbi:hypothetical protein [Hyphomicrobium sp.]|uniref:hypothetical protein n=1 Tax=Hyphomicrobium sp. TaxID=82 RepID=UPI001DF9812B|nr:hypothetical protein [Hyphomicrobium sp.]MBY0561553.1 hypothetical protein [Hyphomicrobium sp.]